MNPEFERAIRAKAARRRQLAALPYPTKVRLVVQLQRMTVPILRARGRTVRAWELPESPPLTPVSRKGGPVQ